MAYWCIVVLTSNYNYRNAHFSSNFPLHISFLLKLHFKKSSFKCVSEKQRSHCLKSTSFLLNYCSFFLWLDNFFVFDSCLSFLNFWGIFFLRWSDGRKRKKVKTHDFSRQTIAQLVRLCKWAIWQSCTWANHPPDGLENYYKSLV